MTMPIPDGSVVITPRQMYDELQATRRAVEQLTNTVDPAISDIRGDVSALYRAKDDGERERTTLGTRVTIVETKLKVIAWVIGVVVIPGLAAVATVLGLVHR